MVSLVPVVPFRWLRWFRWFRSGGFVPLFRVLPHAVSRPRPEKEREVELPLHTGSGKFSNICATTYRTRVITWVENKNWLEFTLICLAFALCSVDFTLCQWDTCMCSAATFFFAVHKDSYQQTVFIPCTNCVSLKCAEVG